MLWIISLSAQNVSVCVSGNTNTCPKQFEHLNKLWISCSIVLLQYCAIVVLCYCSIVLLQYCAIATAAHYIITLPWKLHILSLPSIIPVYNLHIIQK